MTNAKSFKRHTLEATSIHKTDPKGRLEVLENQLRKSEMRVENLKGSETAILLTNISVLIENQENG